MGFFDEDGLKPISIYTDAEVMEVLIWTKPEKLCSCRLGLQKSVGRSECVSAFPPQPEQRGCSVPCLLGPTLARETPSQGTSPSHSSVPPAQAPASINPKPLLRILGFHPQYICVLCWERSKWYWIIFREQELLAMPVNLQSLLLQASSPNPLL